MQIDDFKDIKSLTIEELEAIDPERMDLGTCLQDCALIAETFERGAHSTPSEAATFAPLHRILENNISTSDAMISSMQSYLMSPQQAADKQAKDLSQLGGDLTSSAGAATQTDHAKSNLKIGDTNHSTIVGNTNLVEGLAATAEGIGESVLDHISECIPCSTRVLNYLELRPRIDLAAAIEADITSKLQMLNDIADLLGSFDSYGDFCALMDLLSFMCIPDLQKIMSILTSLFMLDAMDFDALIGTIQGLVVPLIAPIFGILTALLDQYSLIVVNPLDCIIDAINLQLKKLGYELSQEDPLTKTQKSLDNGLQQLAGEISRAKNQIKSAVDLYMGEMKRMFGDLGSTSSSYVLNVFKKLRIVRMLAFVSSMIQAIQKGKSACSANESSEPAKLEIDNFLNTFLNPHSPFNLWIDESGQMHIEESQENLPNIENVFQFEGEPIVSTAGIAVQQKLTQPVQAVLPCKLETSVDNADKVNKFIAELNQV